MALRCLTIDSLFEIASCIEWQSTQGQKDQEVRHIIVTHSELAHGKERWQ